MKFHYSTHALCSVLLGLAVVMLGAYTRLSDAGLGCPDWPGCYGHMMVPQQPAAVSLAEQAFPNALPVTPAKAWLEMIHRYLAGLLVILVATLMIRRYQQPQWPRLLTFIPGLIILQAALGMWTVTWKLHPLAVMPHLMGGMTLVSCLWWHYLDQQPPKQGQHPPLQRALWLVFLLTSLQMLLGGWTSANYAALICADFLFCKGTLWPPMDFHQAFNILNLPIGLNYEGGTLSTQARTAIQMSHRFMAVVITLSISSTMIYAYLKTPLERWPIYRTLLLLLLQISLGVTNILGSLPLWSATLHNTVGLLLLLSLLSLIHQNRYANTATN
ncbi:MAG TPA: COX15/CtaA family protein [Gammaproteobacteria bacterium]|nr:COX15/CtaA family protein [Gammaproteobacteria bacterium]